jgi:hypothetical protein
MQIVLTLSLDGADLVVERIDEAIRFDPNRGPLRSGAQSRKVVCKRAAK